MKPKKNLLSNGLRLSGACLPLLVFTFCGQALHASDWVGGTSTDWNTAANWSDAAVPDAVDASIGTGAGNVPIISATPSVNPLAVNIGSGSVLNHTAGSLSLTAGPNNDWRGGPVLVGWGWSNATYNIADTTTTGGAFTGYGTGSGSVSTGAWGDIRVAAGYWWDYSTSVMNINTSGTVHASGQMYIAGRNGDVGTVNVDAGTVTVAGGWQNSAQIACVSGNWTSTGSLNISGGTVALDYRLVVGAGYAGATGVNVGTVTITGGTLTTNAPNTDNWRGGLNMASGYDGGTGGTATINLDGGTLTTLNVFTESAGNTPGVVGTSIFNFNGGTLQGQAAPDWLNLMGGLTRANVRNGGAIFDTNGTNHYLNQVLEHSNIAGDAAVDGGLTKKGAGQLSLNGGFSYTGNTTVNAGTLSVQSASFNDASTITIAASATLNLNYTGTDSVGTLILAGVPQAIGIYGALGSGAPHETALITGTGMIQVLTSSLSGYALWASTHGNQTPSEDYNNDGVKNGVEYFMGKTDNSFTANPGVVGGTVTWPMSATFSGTYHVQTSTDLVTWANVTSGVSTATAGSLIYTLPTGSDKLFVRLEVNPTL